MNQPANAVSVWHVPHSLTAEQTRQRGPRLTQHAHAAEEDLALRDELAGLHSTSMSMDEQADGAEHWAAANGRAAVPAEGARPPPPRGWRRRACGHRAGWPGQRWGTLQGVADHASISTCAQVAARAGGRCTKAMHRPTRGGAAKEGDADEHQQRKVEPHLAAAAQGGEQWTAQSGSCTPNEEGGVACTLCGMMPSWRANSGTGRGHT